jgi:GDP-mannose 6-dehydrogenase
MRISIFGMGYVGCVSAACLANMGHSVIGVDVNISKLDMIKNGKSPIIEPGLNEIIDRVVKEERLKVTADSNEAIRESEVSMVCVGTPSCPNGSLDTRYLERVVTQIGAALSALSTYHVVTIRSTLLPGMVQSQCIPLLESASKKKVGEEFGVCINPEFLRESTAIKDFQAPPFTLIGEIDKRSGDTLAQVYAELPAPTYRVQPDVASLVKYVSNAYHALKVVFANEIGAVCKELDIDSQKVMNIFSQDKNLNISAAYLRPGFAFGGSCLPKDVRALLYTAKHRDVDIPLISSILPSNNLHIQRAVDQVSALNKRNVALFGLSFKKGTDDLRDSPLVHLAEILIGKGHILRIYDEEVSLSKIFGNNNDYIEKTIPHIKDLMKTDIEDIVEKSEVIIIGKRFKDFERIRSKMRQDQVVIDLINFDNWFPAQCRAIV